MKPCELDVEGFLNYKPLEQVDLTGVPQEWLFPVGSGKSLLMQAVLAAEIRREEMRQLAWELLPRPFSLN